MERSEHIEYFQQPVPTKSNSNCGNDEINTNTTPDRLINDKNRAKPQDGLFDIFEGLENLSVEECWTTNSPNEVPPAKCWDDFFTAQRESFIPTKECYDDAGAFTSENQVSMLNHSVDWNSPESVSPQNEIAVEAGNRELETVVGRLAAFVESSLANLCADEINAKTTTGQLIDDDNQATREDGLFDTLDILENFPSNEDIWDDFGTTANSRDEFVTAQQEDAIPTEECHNDAGTFIHQNQVIMLNNSAGGRFPSKVSPQNEIAVQDGNSELETVIGSLAASAEFSPTSFCADEIYADTTPDQLEDNQNQSTIEDCLIYINENLENFQFIEEIWNDFGATNPQNQVTPQNSWDKFVTTQLQNDENANATPDQQTENQNQTGDIGDGLLDLFEQLESLQPTAEDWNNHGVTNPQNQLTEASSWDKFVTAQLESIIPTEDCCNVAGTPTSQNEITLQAGSSKPETVVDSLVASKVFSPAKLFDNGSQPFVTLHQKVESTTAETSTPPQVLQSATPAAPNGKYYICTICNPSCQFVKTNTKAHFISVHLDEYFLTSKLESVSQNDFKEYCNYLVKQLVLSSLKLYDSDENPLLGCQFCCYTCQREDHMHYHLCGTHEHILKGKLVRLQQDTTSITELRAKANELENSIFSYSYCFRCLNCQRKFRNHISFNRHIKEADCGNATGAGTSSSKEDMSHPRVPSRQSVTCEHCDPPKLLRKCDQSLHHVQHHIEILLISAKTESLSREEHKKNCEDVMDKALLSCKRKSDNGKRPEFVCSFCSKVLTRKQALRYHLYCKHKKILLEMLSK